MPDWKLTNLSSGTYVLAGWLFLRLMGMIYFAAFVSLAVQIRGLVGRNGILPAVDFLDAKLHLGTRRFFRIPTLCWWNGSDSFLLLQAWGGAALSLLLVVGISPVPILILLWVLYLSLFTVCRIFLGYQWDILLLEIGFLAIFLAPLETLPTFPPTTSPSPPILFLCWWLLFRLVFSSGFVKLRSGDPAWRNLTALSYHYETQPLPTPLSWYAHQLPCRFHKASVLVMFLIELVIPFFFFAPPPARYVAAAATVFLMIAIAATGNYCFFNLITIALCVLLFDDAALLPIFKAILPHIQFTDAAVSFSWPLWITLPVGALILLLSVEVVARLFRYDLGPFRPLNKLYEWLEPFRLVNGYGLFAVMTTERPEIIVEGSSDGTHWLAYEFKWKPGDVKRAPRFVAPHQPRLDWQMWFAALSFFHSHPWFAKFLSRLLEGSPDVLRLLKTNPFPDAPPRFIRAVVYDYRFTDRVTRRSIGAWWRRERRGLYSPVLTMREGSAEETAR